MAASRLTDIRLTVIGSGTCVPNPARVSAGFWLDVGDVKLRIDCGPGTVHAAPKFGIEWTAQTHQFITHFHIDHVGDVPALLFAFKYGWHPQPRGPLKILGPAGTQALVTDLCSRLMPGILQPGFPLEFAELAPGESVFLGEGVRLSVAKTPHTAESLAVRVDAFGKSFGFTGDTAPEPALTAFFRGVDTLVAECSFMDDAQGSAHLTADAVCNLARDAAVNHLIATHAYFDPVADNLHHRLAAGFSGRISIAADGDIFDW